jgi:hypothetical protein
MLSALNRWPGATYAPGLSESDNRRLSGSQADAQGAQPSQDECSPGDGSTPTQIEIPLMRWYQKVCLVATMPVMFTACAVDLAKLSKDLQRPKVEFAQSFNWRCDENLKIPHGNTVEECSRCRNAATTPQTVTVNKVEHSVKSGGSVLMCSTAAWVEGQ